MAQDLTDIEDDDEPRSTKKANNMVLYYTILGFLIGMPFPIGALLIGLSGHEFSLSDIWDVHMETKYLWIIDSAPLVIAAIFNYFARKNRKQNEDLERMLAEKNDIFTRNSLIAKRIGEGDLYFDTNEIDKDDLLGQSLLIMKNNLVATSQRENEQNWIAKGKEIIGDILRQRNNISELAYETIINLIEYINAVQGAFYLYDDDNEKLVNIATYAYNRKKYITQEFRIGIGLVGQAAFERDIIYRREIPDDYVTISSGILGDKKPKTLLLSPLISDEKLQGVIEFASLNDDMPDKTLRLIQEVSQIIAQTIFNLKVNTQTEKLLREAQEMTKLLQKNEEELRKNADEMRKTQLELQETNKQLEAQIREVERGQKRQYALLENASEVISIYDETGIVTYESPSAKNILGYDPDYIVGKSAYEKFDEQSRSRFKEVFQRLIDYPDDPVTFEYSYQKNDEQLWLEATGRNLLSNAAIQGIIFNTRDITVRKLAEKMQRMSGEMQALSENSLDMIARLSPEGKFFYVNPVAEQFTGLKKQDMLQKQLDEVQLNEKIAAFFREALAQVMQTQRMFESETDFPTAGGENRIIQFNAIPEYNKEKELETILFVARDITERKQIEMEIEEKNKSITESINYAQRIQSAIIPSLDDIGQKLPKFFMFYRPRDVVSGDFPWFFEKNGNIYIAAVDCTGHGVPGALLSFIGYFNLNSIADHADDLHAGQVLDLLHLGVRKTLKQDNDDQEARDGMDIALCKINFEKGILHFSGAHRPLYYLNAQRELIQYKGTMQAIGGKPPRKGKDEKKFEDFEIKFVPGEKCFFFSDGLPDQIGGEEGRKYRPGRIKELIEANPEMTMPEYRQLFEKDFLEWKGLNKQVDDILLIGIEF